VVKSCGNIGVDAGTSFFVKGRTGGSKPCNILLQTYRTLRFTDGDVVE
jgi:hypothetical protein